MCCLLLSETSSVSWRYLQPCLLLRALKEPVLISLSACWELATLIILCLLDVSLQYLPQSSWSVSLCVPVSKLHSSCEDTSHNGLGSILMVFILAWYLQRLHFQTRSHSQVPGVRFSAYLLGVWHSTISFQFFPFPWFETLYFLETLVQFLVGKILWRRDRLPIPVFLGFPCGSAGKESACNAGDLGLIPGLGRSPGWRERLPTPVFWPGEFHGLYSPCGCKESDMTERLSLSLSFTSWKTCFGGI